MSTGRALPAVCLTLATVTAMALSACSSTSALSLHTGDCLQAPSGDTVTDVEVVSCEHVHDLEVVGTFDLDQDALPPEGELTALAQQRCSQIFADYVGTDVEQSVLDLTWLTPTQQSWTASGDRTVACLAGGAGQSLSSTVRDSHR